MPVKVAAKQQVMQKAENPSVIPRRKMLNVFTGSTLTRPVATSRARCWIQLAYVHPSARDGTRSHPFFGTIPQRGAAATE